MNFKNNDMPAISVIIPVYNVEKYLRRCLDSIINQSFSDFEVILIDDGSTDQSLRICKEYEATDKRIHVFTYPNAGSSVARNRGLDIASGEYIIHFDSDDWVEPTILEKLYSEAKNSDSDIVACGYGKDKGSGLYDIDNYPFYSESLQTLYRHNALYSAVWNKLVKKELYDNNNIRFVPGIGVMEDWVVTTRLRFLSRKTTVVHEALYHYFVAPRPSITTLNVKKYPESEFRVVKILEDFFIAQDVDHVFSEKILSVIKLRAKFKILKYKSLGGATLWKTLYPESHKYIMSIQDDWKIKAMMMAAIVLPSAIFDRLYMAIKAK